MPDVSFKVFSLVTSLVLVLVTATFPTFFFYATFANGISVLSIGQVLTQVAWIALIVVPPAAAFLAQKNRKAARNLLIFGGLFWPVTLVLVHVTLAVTTGNPYLSYLLQYPIFLFSDVFLPIFLVSRAVTDTRA